MVKPKVVPSSVEVYEFQEFKHGWRYAKCIGFLEWMWVEGTKTDDRWECIECALSEIALEHGTTRNKIFFREVEK